MHLVLKYNYSLRMILSTITVLPLSPRDAGYTFHPDHCKVPLCTNKGRQKGRDGFMESIINYCLEKKSNGKIHCGELHQILQKIISIEQKFSEEV